MNTFLLHLKNKLPAALSCKLFVLRFLQTGTTVDGQMTVVGMTAVGMPKVRSIQEITVHMNILKLSFFPSTIADWSVLAAEITCLRPKICIIYSQDVQQPSLGRFKVRFQKVSFGCHRIVFHRFFFYQGQLWIVSVTSVQHHYRRHTVCSPGTSTAPTWKGGTFMNLKNLKSSREDQQLSRIPMVLYWTKSIKMVQAFLHPAVSLYYSDF